MRILRSLFGLLKISKAIPAFSSGSTSAKDTVSNTAENAPDILPMQHCGNWKSTSGVISSEHPYAAGFGCMYTVTSPEPIEFRIRKMEIKVTENCLFDNIQLYDGHKELGWICQLTTHFEIGQKSILATWQYILKATQESITALILNGDPK
ncbi:unnamed protein product [Oikopleura dioica]|uniref:CUB domain-containing protein n=1 Tax=Oikopleura dioica TaxID=34765 RepID=E4YP03_OIKDI|nr:unnamed protein product [Oikopleura dioica]